MNRGARMVLGLGSLILVIGVAGGLLRMIGVEGVAGAWVTLGIGVAWFAVTVWWVLRAPAQLSDDARGRYLAFLRHAEFRSLDEQDGGGDGDRR